MDHAAILASARWTLADELEGLSATQWKVDSLCEGWTNHDVLGHLTTTWAVSAPRVAMAVAKARGNIDRAVDGLSREVAAGHTTAELIQDIRDHAGDARRPPMLTLRAPITDVVCHAGDILHPLGRTITFAPEVLACALGFLAGEDTGVREARGRAVGFLPPSRVAGLVFVPDDVDQRFGTGSAEVTGPAMAIVGAVLRRSAWFGQLQGDGVQVLASRS